ncbi:MAG: hypothetical protein KDA89_23285, partial [Planctomycetaceae bacterium]|nr:hypothetical protein [Planctomycetaceae bacterium]
MGRRASAPAFERSDVEELSSAVQELSGQIGVLLQAVDELREAITWVTQNSRVVILPETPESPETATSRVRESVVCDVINLNEQPSEMTLPPSVVSANIEQETISAQHGGHAPQESPSRQLSSAVQKQLFSESSADSTSGIVRLSDPEPDSLPDEATPSQIERALNQLAEALDAGHSEQLTAYLRTLARFHTYSFCNILLISLQRPDATFVAGFHAWKKKFRRSVRRGEKGIAILAPVVRGQKRLADPDEADDDDPEEEHSPS